MTPLIIPNYNQLTFLKNLINWWRFYYPENPVYVIDNGSDYEPLLKWYKSGASANIILCEHNDFIGNLTRFLNENTFEYYVISDPDIMPHPTTPPNFLDYFKQAIDEGYHRCGFDLIWEDIPSWNPKAEWIKGDQRALKAESVKIGEYEGLKSPIDTTFCMYTSKNSGWHAPMNGKDWGNCVRLFKAIHLTWYLDKDYLNEEMRHYFETANRRDITKPSAGRNHFQPYTGINE